MKKTILPWLLSMVMIVTFIPVISFANESQEGTEKVAPEEIEQLVDQDIIEDATQNESDISTIKGLESSKGIVDQGTCGNNITWALFDDGQLVIEGTGSMSDYTLKESVTADIPQTPWYKYKSSITKIVIGEGVTYIGNYAFHYLDKARSVELSEGLKTIGFSAFGGCGITDISFPESLITIGGESFWNCESLTDICLPSKLTTVGAGAFQFCTGLKNIIVPDSVTSFGSFVFSDCSNLETITMTTNASCPHAESWTLFSDSDFLENLKTVTYTGTGSINEWNSAYSKAKTVNIGSGIKEIEDYSFAYCSRLTVINMPDSIETISNVGTFAEVNAKVNYICSTGNILKSLEKNYSGTLTWNEQHPWKTEYETDIEPTYEKEGQESIHCSVCNVIKEGSERPVSFVSDDDDFTVTVVDSIGQCGDNVYYEIEDGVLELTGTGATYDYYSGSDQATGQNHSCSPFSNSKLYSKSLYKIIVGEGITTLGNGLFARLNVRDEIVLPSSLTTIKDGVFEGYMYRTPITIPENVTSIYETSMTNIIDYYSTVNNNPPIDMYFTGDAPVIKTAYHYYVEAMRPYTTIHYDHTKSGWTSPNWEGFTTTTTHELVHYNAKAPTCTEVGWEEYDKCSGCDYTTYKELPKTRHNIIHHNAKAPTCTEVGWEEYDTCSRCNYTTYEELPKASHDLIFHNAKAPTCTEVGWEEYETCSNCDYTTYEELPILSHDVIHHEAKEPTCTEVGWEEYETCSRCDYTTYEELPKAKHSFEHHKNASGYLKDGIEYDVCATCGGVFNKKTLPGYSTSYVKKFKISKGKKSFTAKWKKQSKANRKKFNGYQLRYSTNADMSDAKTINLSKKSRSKKVKKLGKKVRYYVQIRSYVTTGAGTFYSGWSTKSVVTK